MDNNAIFDEKYRVIAIDEQNLILRGVRSGEVPNHQERGSGKPSDRGGLSAGETNRAERSLTAPMLKLEQSTCGVALLVRRFCFLLLPSTA